MLLNHCYEVPSFINVFIYKNYYMQTSLLFLPPAHYSTLLLILLMRQSWTPKSSRGLHSLLRRLLKLMPWPRHYLVARMRYLIINYLSTADVRVVLETCIYVQYLFNISTSFIVLKLCISDSLLLWSQAFFSANASAQASRKSSPRVNNAAVQKAVSDL